MAININPVDFRGFSLGGSSTPNIPVPGELGLKALQLKMGEQEALRQQAINVARLRQADEQALRQTMLEKAKMQQQAYQFNQAQNLDAQKLGLLQKQNQMDNTLNREELGYNMSLNDRKLGLAERELDMNDFRKQQGLAQEQLKLEMLALKDKKKEDIDTMGAFAVQARMAMDKVQNPEDARTMQLEILNEAVENGYITKDVAKQMKQMPLSGFKNALDFKILQLDKVKEYQTMNKVQNPNDDSGDVTITRADGSSIQVKGLTKTSENQLQKSAIGIEKQLQNLDMLEEKLDEKYLTWKGQSTAGATKLEEKAKGIPIVEQLTKFGADIISGMDQKERKKYLQNMQAFANQTFQVFQDYRMQTTGMQAAFAEITEIQDKYLSGNMSFNQYVGAIGGLKEKYKADLELVKKQLSGGIETSPSQPKTFKYNPSTGKLE